MALVAGAASLAWTLAARPVVENGQSRAFIVLGEPDNAFHAAAAQDLQDHIKLAAGVAVPIIDSAAARGADRNTTLLVVGAGPLSEELGVKTRDLEPEEYRIQTKGNSVVFVGGDIGEAAKSSAWAAGQSSNATAWAVGYFLDRYLGVRWLWPGELGTFVPARRSFIVPDIDVQERPSLLQRRLRSRRRGAADAWLRHHQMGSRMTFAFGHAFNAWWDKYNDSHPDYFAVPPEGEKQRDARHVKLRIGNPAVTDRIIAEWREAGRPDNWNVCPNDGYGFDTSPESRAMDLPDVFDPMDIWRGRANLTRRHVRFWNGLLVRMRKEHPAATLSTYAYYCYRSLPADVKLEAGYVAGMVPTYVHTNDWQEWNAAGAKLILRPNWWNLGGSAPHLPLHAQGDYFRFAMAHSMIGFDFDSLMGEWGNQGVLYYVIARLSTRPDMTVDQAIDEFTSAFGAAAPVMREYVDYWEQFTAKVASPVEAGGEVSQNPHGLFETLCRQHGIRTGILGSTWTIIPFLYSDEVIAPAEQILERARTSAAKDGEVIAKRIGFLKTALALLKEHREVIRLADKRWRNPGESQEDFVRQIRVFETRRKEAIERYGPIGFDRTIPSRLRIADPRTLEER